MNDVNSRDRLVGGASQLDRVEDLLERYPDTNATEGEEIAAFLKTATPLEVGLLSSNARLWTKAEQYKQDHPQHFRTSARELALWLGLGAAVIAAIVLLWDVGAL